MPADTSLVARGLVNVDNVHRHIGNQPIGVVRSQLQERRPSQVADGYHVYSVDRELTNARRALAHGWVFQVADAGAWRWQRVYKVWLSHLGH